MTTTSMDTMTAMPEAATDKLATTRRRLPRFGVTFGVLWLGTLIFLAAFSDFLPFIRNYGPAVNGAENARFGPGVDFWFGSDTLGRDVFARCVYGARTSLTIASASILVGTVVGGTLGMVAGYFKGWVDRMISIFTDSLLALPAIIIASLLVGRFDVLADSDIKFLGFGFGWMSRTWSVTIVFSLLSIAPVARIVRAQTLSLSQREYVLAARSLGASTRRVLWREIVPNVIPALTAVIFTGIAILLAAEGGLAFLGYSVPKPPSWGSMIADDRDKIEEAWWTSIFPCFMLFFTVLAFNLIGDRLARRFDIREAAL
ncbi:MAG: ABC transporter permease [Acidimicrobiia bacterium]|nr:ABC transporter permease [Acidimicrobiia bacterium]